MEHWTLLTSRSVVFRRPLGSHVVLKRLVRDWMCVTNERSSRLVATASPDLMRRQVPYCIRLVTKTFLAELFRFPWTGEHSVYPADSYCSHRRLVELFRAPQASTTFTFSLPDTQ